MRYSSYTTTLPIVIHPLLLSLFITRFLPSQLNNLQTIRIYLYIFVSCFVLNQQAEKTSFAKTVNTLHESAYHHLCWSTVNQCFQNAMLGLIITWMLLTMQRNQIEVTIANDGLHSYEKNGFWHTITTSAPHPKLSTVANAHEHNVSVYRKRIRAKIKMENGKQN